MKEIKILDRHGKIYNLSQVASALDTSHTWAVRHQNTCKTFEDFERQERKIVRRKDTAPPRVNIEDLPVGSFEAKMRCPPANTMTGSEVLTQIDHERDFSLERQRVYEAKKYKAGKKYKKTGKKRGPKRNKIEDIVKKAAGI